MTRGSSENPGGLGVLLRLLGIGPRETPGLPYGLRDDFLSRAEMVFYRTLCAAAGDQAVVCPKVNLADLFVSRPNENHQYRNRSDRKHVDFLVCDPSSMRPVLGIELDDSSHKRATRQARDEFVDAVFRAAGLPLAHVPVRASYNVGEYSRWLAPYLGVRPAPATATPVAPASPPVSVAAKPMCPKCGVPMVLMIVSRGEQQGERFYGCPNYPSCPQVRPFPERGPR